MRVWLSSWLLVLATAGCEAVLGADFGPRTLDPVSSASAGGAGGSPTVGGAGGAATTSGPGGAGGGGAAPTDCWGLDPTEWTETINDPSTFVGAGATDFALSPDGLTLSYVAQTPAGNLRPHAATRPSRTMAFDSGMALANWAGFPPLGHVYLWGTEMIFQSDVSQSATDWELYLSHHTGQGWAQPARALPAHTADGYDDKFGHVVEGGTRLFFVRNDGPSTALGPRHQLYEATRPDNGEPGTPFSDAKLVPIDSLAADVHHYCVAPSPDGQRLFLGATPGPDNPTTQLYYLERTATGWTAAVRLAMLEHPNPAINCPTSVTADGCELTVTRFEMSNVFALAKRGP